MENPSSAAVIAAPAVGIAVLPHQLRRRRNVANVMIIAVLAAIALVALKGSLKHFRGEGSCCGGGSTGITRDDIPVKILENPKLGEKVVEISGMHCENCVFSVTKAINRIEGVSADVDLKKKRAIVSYDREISEDAIRKAVEQEGFKVTEVRNR